MLSVGTTKSTPAEFRATWVLRHRVMSISLSSMSLNKQCRAGCATQPSQFDIFLQTLDHYVSLLVGNSKLHGGYND